MIPINPTKLLRHNFYVAANRSLPDYRTFCRATDELTQGQLTQFSQGIRAYRVTLRIGCLSQAVFFQQLGGRSN